MQRSGIIVVLALLLAVAVAAGVLVMSAGVGRSNVTTLPVVVGTLTGAVLVVIAAVMVMVLVRRRPVRGERPKPSAAADHLGLTYRQKGDKGFGREYVDLPGIRSNAQVLHVMQGRLGERDLLIFQTIYMIHTGQASVPVTHTVYIVATPVWPRVTITPRSWMARLLRRMRPGRGLVLDDPTFNQMFKVKAADEDFALTLLSPELQARILEKPGVRWHLAHGRLALIYSGVLRTDRMESSLARLEEFLELIPPELEEWAGEGTDALMH